MSQAFGALTADMIHRRRTPTPGEPVTWLQDLQPNEALSQGRAARSAPQQGAQASTATTTTNGRSHLDSKAESAKARAARKRQRMRKTLRLDPKLNAHLLHAAEEKGVSQQTIMEDALKSALHI